MAVNKLTREQLENASFAEFRALALGDKPENMSFEEFQQSQGITQPTQRDLDLEESPIPEAIQPVVQPALRLATGFAEGLADTPLAIAEEVTRAGNWVAKTFANAGILVSQAAGGERELLKTVGDPDFKLPRVKLEPLLEERNLLVEANMLERAMQQGGDIASSFVLPINIAGKAIAAKGLVKRFLIDSTLLTSASILAQRAEARQHDVELTPEDYMGSAFHSAMAVPTAMIGSKVAVGVVQKLLGVKELNEVLKRIITDTSLGAAFEAAGAAQEGISPLSPEGRERMMAGVIGFNLGNSVGALFGGPARPFSKEQTRDAIEITGEVIRESGLGAKPPPEGLSKELLKKMTIAEARGVYENLTVPFLDPGGQVRISAKALAEGGGFSPEVAQAAVREPVNREAILARKTKEMQLLAAENLGEGAYMETAYRLNELDSGRRKIWEAKRKNLSPEDRAGLAMTEQRLQKFMDANPELASNMVLAMEGREKVPGRFRAKAGGVGEEIVRERRGEVDQAEMERQLLREDVAEATETIGPRFEERGPTQRAPGRPAPQLPEPAERRSRDQGGRYVSGVFKSREAAQARAKQMREGEGRDVRAVATIEEGGTRGFRLFEQRRGGKISEPRREPPTTVTGRKRQAAVRVKERQKTRGEEFPRVVRDPENLLNKTFTTPAEAKEAADKLVAANKGMKVKVFRSGRKQLKIRIVEAPKTGGVQRRVVRPEPQTRIIQGAPESRKKRQAKAQAAKKAGQALQPTGLRAGDVVTTRFGSKRIIVPPVVLQNRQLVRVTPPPPGKELPSLQGFKLSEANWQPVGKTYSKAASAKAQQTRLAKKTGGIYRVIGTTEGFRVEKLGPPKTGAGATTGKRPADSEGVTREEPKGGAAPAPAKTTVKEQPAAPKKTAEVEPPKLPEGWKMKIFTRNRSAQAFMNNLWGFKEGKRPAMIEEHGPGQWRVVYSPKKVTAPRAKPSETAVKAEPEIVPNKKIFDDYQSALTNAEKLANESGAPYGLVGHKEPGSAKKQFRIYRLPAPEVRFGSDLRAQVVEPMVDRPLPTDPAQIADLTARTESRLKKLRELDVRLTGVARPSDLRSTIDRLERRLEGLKKAQAPPEEPVPPKETKAAPTPEAEKPAATDTRTSRSRPPSKRERIKELAGNTVLAETAEGPIGIEPVRIEGKTMYQIADLPFAKQGNRRLLVEYGMKARVSTTGATARLPKPGREAQKEASALKRILLKLGFTQKQLEDVRRLQKMPDNLAPRNITKVTYLDSPGPGSRKSTYKQAWDAVANRLVRKMQSEAAQDTVIHDPVLRRKVMAEVERRRISDEEFGRVQREKRIAEVLGKSVRTENEARFKKEIKGKFTKTDDIRPMGGDKERKRVSGYELPKSGIQIFEHARLMMPEGAKITAADKKRFPGWSVTHQKTGLKFGLANRLEDAKVMALRLSELMDWRRLNKPTMMRQLLGDANFEKAKSLVQDPYAVLPGDKPVTPQTKANDVMKRTAQAPEQVEPVTPDRPIDAKESQQIQPGVDSGIKEANVERGKVEKDKPKLKPGELGIALIALGTASALAAQDEEERKAAGGLALASVFFVGGLRRGATPPPKPGTRQFRLEGGGSPIERWMARIGERHVKEGNRPSLIETPEQATKNFRSKPGVREVERVSTELNEVAVSNSTRDMELTVDRVGEIVQGGPYETPEGIVVPRATNKLVNEFFLATGKGLEKVGGPWGKWLNNELQRYVSRVARRYSVYEENLRQLSTERFDVPLSKIKRPGKARSDYENLHDVMEQLWWRAERTRQVKRDIRFYSNVKRRGKIGELRSRLGTFKNRKTAQAALDAARQNNPQGEYKMVAGPGGIRVSEVVQKKGSFSPEIADQLIRRLQGELAQAEAVQMDLPNSTKIEAKTIAWADRRFNTTPQKLEALWGRKFSPKVLQEAEKFARFVDQHFSEIKAEAIATGLPFMAWQRGGYLPTMFPEHVFVPSDRWREIPIFKKGFEEKMARAQRLQSNIAVDLNSRLRLPHNEVFAHLRSYQNKQLDPYWKIGLDDLFVKRSRNLEDHKLLDAKIGVEWDFARISPRYFRPSYGRLEFAKQFGVYGEIPYKVIGAAGQQGYNMGEMMRLFDVATGQGAAMMRGERNKFLDELSGWVGFFKLGGAGISQLSSHPRLLEHMRVRDFAKSWSEGLQATIEQSSVLPESVKKRFAPSGKRYSMMAAEARSMGQSELVSAIMEMRGTGPKAAALLLKANLTTFLDRWGRNIAAIGGRYYMDYLMSEYAAAKGRNPAQAKKIEARLTELFGRDPAMMRKALEGEWLRNPNSETGKAERNFLEVSGAQLIGDRSHGRNMPIDMPLNYSHPVMGHIYKLQVFNFRLTAESFRQFNPTDPASPLRTQAGALRMLAGLTAGLGTSAVLLDLKRRMRHEDPEKWAESSPYRKVADLLSFHGVFTWFVDFFDVITGRYGPPLERGTGVTFGTLGEAMNAFSSTAKQSIDERNVVVAPMGRFLFRQIPTSWHNYLGIPTGKELGFKVFPSARQKKQGGIGASMKGITIKKKKLKGNQLAR